MITLEDSTIQLQEKLVVPKHFLKFFVYKRWKGIITNYALNTISVKGDCTDFLSSGDEIIISSSPDLNVEWEVTSLSLGSGLNETDIVVNGLGTLEVNVPNSDYIYKKIDVSEYLLRDGIGDLRKHFEYEFGKLRPFQWNLSLLDDGVEFILSGTRTNPGIFYKDVYVSQIVSAVTDGSFTKLTLYEPTTTIFDESLFMENSVLFISGKRRNFESKIVKVSTFSKSIWIYDDITDDITVGDQICVNIQPKFLCKATIAMQGNITDLINVFFGVIYPKNITKGNLRLDLIALSLIKDFDENFALKVSDESNGILPKIPGIRLMKYYSGTRVFEKQYVAEIKYKPISGNISSVTGIRITKCSSDTGTGNRVLIFRRPDLFQWDGGSWTQFDEELDDQTLTAADGSTITVDVRPTDYQSSDAEEVVYVEEQSKLNSVVMKRGPVTISVDDGDEVQIITRFQRIWVDESYVAGTINDDADINDISNDERMELIPSVSSAAFVIYFCAKQKFNGIKITGLSNKGSGISNLIFEYSLSFGTDPACFKTLNNVNDETNGFADDGIITWESPIDWQKKSKIGSTSDAHLYCIRIRKTSTTVSSKTAHVINPIIACFGKDGDIYTFDSQIDLLSSNEINDEIIIRYDDDSDLVPCVWKQCIRVIDLINQMIDASGYGNNLVVSDSKLNLSNSMLNIWGKPFTSENRQPTAMCSGYGSCDGYIFVCFKNAIYRLKGNDEEWELLYECYNKYTLHAIHYYDRVPEYPGYKYFILAIGYRDPVQDSYDEADYRIQPEQIIIRIDDINTDNYTVTFDILGDGGTVSGELHGYTGGEGLIDTKFILRSGAFIVSDPGPPAVRTGVIGEYTPLSHYSENVVIPFSQLVFRHCNFAFDDDIEIDVISLIDNRGSFNGDLTTPTHIDPGFYFIGANKELAGKQYDMAFRFSLGQVGGYNRIYYELLGGDINFGIYGQVPVTDTGTITNYLRRFGFQGLLYGLGVDPNDVKTGYLSGAGLKTETSYGGTADFVARSELLCAVQLPKGEDLIPHDYVIQAVYNDFYQLTGVDKFNEKNIEITTARKAANQIIITDGMEIWHYDSSLASWSNVGTSMPINIQLDQNDELLIADNYKFGRLYIQVTVATHAPTLTAYLSDGAAGWISPVDPEGFLAGISGSDYGISDLIISRDWFKDDGAGGNITDKYIYRLVQTDATTVCTINNIGPTRRVLWRSDHDDYYAATVKTEDYVPLDICYDEDNDICYGSLLDQIDISYTIFCILDVLDTAKDESTTNPLLVEQLTDIEMQPVGFVCGDGYCYFVLADRKYKRKTAELWRAKYDGGWTTEKLTNLKPGEWDCPTRLVYINGSVYGFTAPNYNYFWEWSNSFDLRLPIANFGNRNITDILNDLTMMINRIVIVDENSVTRVVKRLEDDPAVDKVWNDFEHIINIEFVRSAETVTGVIVNWEDEDGEFTGKVEVGDCRMGNDVKEIKNDFIKYPELAYLVGYIAWNFFSKHRKEIEGTCTFMYQHQLFDVVKLLLTSKKFTNNVEIDDWSRFQLNSFTLSWQRRNARFLLFEADKEVAGES